MTVRTVTITVYIPKDCDADDVVQFAADALTSWGGALNPEDPLFDSLKIKSVKTSEHIYIVDKDKRDVTGRRARVTMLKGLAQHDKATAK